MWGIDRAEGVWGIYRAEGVCGIDRVEGACGIDGAEANLPVQWPICPCSGMSHSVF